MPVSLLSWELKMGSLLGVLELESGRPHHLCPQTATNTKSEESLKQNPLLKLLGKLIDKKLHNRRL